MRHLLKHPIVIALITIFAVLYYLSLDNSAQKAKTSSDTVAVLEKEVDQLTNEVTILDKRIENANHPVTQEKMIRNELLMQKPGEYVLQLPQIEATKTTAIKTKTPTPWEEWQKILLD